MVQCPACGVPVDVADRFCATCGAVLAGGLEHTGAITSIIHTTGHTGSGAMSPVGSGARSDLPSGAAMLIVLRGPGEGTEYPLAQRIDVVSVGRSQEAEVFLDDVTVSRHHAELRHGAEGWSIRDAGSLNGTYVNRRRVEDHQLSGGDEIQIGKFRFIFLVGVEPER